MVITAPVETVETPVIEVSTPLRLSEALRLGAMGTKQTFGRLGDLRNTACAIGAVYHGFGFNGYDAESMELNRIISAVTVACGGCDWNSSLSATIVHMNDAHKMPREKIADYIESLGF